LPSVVTGVPAQPRSTIPAAAAGPLAALLDALERKRVLLWTGNVLVEMDVEAAEADTAMWRSQATMVLDADDYAALRLLAEGEQDAEDEPEALPGWATVLSESMKRWLLELPPDVLASPHLWRLLAPLEGQTITPVMQEELIRRVRQLDDERASRWVEERKET
jgi:hypothetical protein